MKKIFLGLVFCSFLISGAAFACEDSADKTDPKNPSNENVVVPNHAAKDDDCVMFSDAYFCNHADGHKGCLIWPDTK